MLIEITNVVLPLELYCRELPKVADLHISIRLIYIHNIEIIFAERTTSKEVSFNILAIIPDGFEPLLFVAHN